MFILRAVKETLLIFFLSVFCSSLAQDSIPEIENRVQEAATDTNLFDDLIYLGRYYQGEDSLKSIQYFQQAFSVSNQLGDKNRKGRAFHYLGRHHIVWSKDMDKAISYYRSSIELFKQAGNIEEEIAAIIRLGGLFEYYLLEESRAIELYHEAILAHPDDPTIACSMNNALGNVMKSTDEDQKAIDYYTTSETYFVQLQNPSPRLNKIQMSNDKNRGVLYRNNESYDTAEFYMNRSLSRSIEAQDSGWIARNHNSLAILYMEQDQFTQAIEAFERSIEIKRAINYQQGVITSCSNIAFLYLKLGDYSNAKRYIDEADTVVYEGCPIGRLIQLTSVKADYYADTRDYKKAYENLQIVIDLSDSLKREDENRLSKDLEAKYQNENNKIQQQKLKADLLAADLREKNKSEQIKRQNLYIILFITGGILMLGLIIFVVRANMRRKATNRELKHKNAEILEKSQEISLQKQQIEEKNQEIVDSITYAKRIQEAILPSNEVIKSALPESFILYLPKDILAGDFYWLETVDDWVIWAAADCTGHGIPGAMVSVVCHNALNRSVHEYQLRKPGDILNKTRALVIESFEKSEHHVKDGMDIALCCFNTKTSELQFSGANNPLWLVREQTKFEAETPLYITEHSDLGLMEIKGDKQPIGNHYVSEPFKTHSLQLQKGDEIYVFTDGFADQFGGDKGKKLKYKNLKSLILQHAKSNLEEQQKQLNDSFFDWKGDFEQLDDVCIIGVKL